VNKQPDILEGIHYATGESVQVKIEEGQIAYVKPVNKLNSVEPVRYIAPGFFDNQVNGFAGVSFAFGNSNLTEEGILKATGQLWKHGVTTYLPTLTTNSHDVLKKNLALLSLAVNDPIVKGSIPGFHLEGPFISPEEGYVGAHPRHFVRLPDWDEFQELNKAAGGKILQITLAPEVSGAQEFIKLCKKQGVVVAVGHHNANREQLDEAVKNGACISTHLGNGCANMIHRHNNPLWSQLANDSLWISMICDGFHLLPEEISVFYKIKGADRIILTSDVTSYATLDPGIYTTETGETVELTKEGKLHNYLHQYLYGSASPLSAGVGFVMKVTGCTLKEAIQMASTNPARLYNLNDRGTLEAGKRADLVLLTLNEFKVQIYKTFVNGSLVYSAE
jgi:N-acetylglucosamine-6-phosphate deacetylase